MQRGVVNIGVLLSASLSLARRAGGIIRRVQREGLKVAEKGFDDPVTQADIESQRLIICGLLSVCKGLKIVGEEDTPEREAGGESPELDLVDLSKVPSHLQSVPEEDVCVFVDPLDATKEFTLGRVECVMTLIGITVRGRPVAGVMHQPFAGAARNEERSVWGMEGMGVYGIDNRKEPKEKNPEEVVLVTSASHGSATIEAAIKALGPNIKVMREGGCGFKALLVAQGVADVYVYPQPGTKRWDTCAPEAILRALGGQLTNVHGRDIIYAPTGDMMNASLVASLNATLHSSIVKQLSPLVAKH